MDDRSQLVALVPGYRHPARTHDGSIGAKALLESVGGATMLGMSVLAMLRCSVHHVQLLEALLFVLLPIGLILFVLGIHTSWFMTARRCRFRVIASNVGGSLATLGIYFYFATASGGFGAGAFIGTVFMSLVLGISAFVIAGTVFYPIGLALDYFANRRGEIQLLGCGTDHERTN